MCKVSLAFHLLSRPDVGVFKGSSSSHQGWCTLAKRWTRLSRLFWSQVSLQIRHAGRHGQRLGTKFDVRRGERPFRYYIYSSDGRSGAVLFSKFRRILSNSLEASPKSFRASGSPFSRRTRFIIGPLFYLARRARRLRRLCFYFSHVVCFTWTTKQLLKHLMIYIFVLSFTVLHVTPSSTNAFVWGHCMCVRVCVCVCGVFVSLLYEMKNGQHPLAT